MSARIINRGRGPEIEGTRITVFDVWEYMQAGWHHTAIAALFRLSSEQVLAAVEYIERHKAEVTTGYDNIMQRINRGNPPELAERFTQSHARLQARLAAQQAPEASLAEYPGGQ